MNCNFAQSRSLLMWSGVCTALAIEGNLHAQGQPVTLRSKTAGLEVHTSVTNASPGLPNGIQVTIHGPPQSVYALLLDTNPACFDNTFAPLVPGAIGPNSLALPTLINPLSAFFFAYVPLIGVIPPTGEQTISSFQSFPIGFAAPLYWQAGIIPGATTPGSPLNPAGTSVYMTNAQTRVPVPPINVPSTTGYVTGPNFPFSGNNLHRDVEQADVDNDGDLDHVVVSTNAIQIYRMIAGTPNPVVAAPLVYGPPPGMNAMNSVEFADLDDDGFLEMIVGGSGTTYLAIFQNLGTPVPGPSITNWLQYALLPGGVALQPQFFNVNDIETGDVNLDGLPDVAAATGLAPCVGEQNLLFQNFTTATGAPLLVDVTVTNMPIRLEDSEDCEFFDLEGDGDIDIVFGNFDGPTNALVVEGQNYVYVNNGGGNYAVLPVVPVGIPQETLDVVAEDFNNDGLDDLYFGNWVGNGPANCGQPFTIIQQDALLLNNPAAPGTFTIASNLLPDNPAYLGLTPSLPWATTDAEAVSVPLDVTQTIVAAAGLPTPVFIPQIPKDYDHDGDVDILIALGSSGLPGAAAAPVAGITRGLLILQNQLSQVAPGSALPPFIIDSSLAGLANPNPGAVPDYVDVEYGDWLLFNPQAFIGVSAFGDAFEKDIGCVTIRNGTNPANVAPPAHFVQKKVQG